MLPGGDAATPLQDFLNTASIYRDFARSGRPLHPWMKGYIAAMSEAPHDGSCVMRLLDDAIAKIQL
jgi:hypothetical protein